MMMFNIFFFLCLTSICYLYIYIHANRYLLPSTFYIPTVIFSLMASLLQMGLPLIYRNTLVKSIQRPRSFTCTIVAKTTRADESPVVLRRSANYQPSLWDHHHLLSVENKYSKDESVHDRDLLKENVRTMLNDERTTHLEQLELIDDLQKLGVSYHFEREIDNILTFTYHKDRRNFMEYDMEYDLHATALEFRLLRQHGFNVPEDVFDVFMENCGKFDSHDINGLLSLYEASYLSTKSDTKLQKNIRVFATQQLRNFVDTHGSKDLSSCDVEMVVQALDMPYHWRMGRLATRWYIDMYGKKHNKNPMLLEFSKLDFSIVQAVYQEELKYWRIIFGLLDKSKSLNLGSWDVNRLDDLPEYMRLCFLVVYNEVNNIGCDILRNKDINVIPFLKKSWADVCKAYLVEAMWYKGGYKPNLEEYMQNAWISISSPTIFVHFYCVFSEQLSVQVLETLSEHRQNIARCSSFVFRLANDLVTSPDEMARGDVLKSIQCYMNETGVSEEKARMHVQKMINDMWDEMNYEKIENHSSLIPQDFAETVINLARMSQCMYQYGDGQSREIQSH
ncbi:hypothetical protein HID58_052862 [Brassica napus]|uniref:Uncharacterized protein n=1 Tax=Brassica napus TaxID=3708 RepID=A0ABQ8AD92_BRANA|nr:hypothetical protein HID58_052862 [Brassica napus]